MTLRERIRAGVVIMIALLAIGFVFLGNQRLVHAQEVSGTTISNGVFCILDHLPVTNIFTGVDCGGATVQSAELTLVNNVVGGTVAASAWTLSAVGSDDSIAGTTGAASVTDAVVPAETYALSASGPSGYTPSTWSCSGATVEGNAVILGADAQAICTITQTFNSDNNGGGGDNGGGTTPTTGSLMVNTIVVGGTSAASDFDIHVENDGTEVAGSPQAGSQSGTTYTLNPGTYTVSQSGAPAGYTATYSHDCDDGGSVTVSAEGEAVCLITDTFNSDNGGGGGGGDTSSDLSLTKSASESTAAIGDHVTYTLTATNHGPAAATGVAVTDTLPAGLTYVSDDSTTSSTFYAATTTDIWTIGNLADGASATLHIVASVTSGTVGSSIVNSASVSGTNTDNNTDNNTATAPITISGATTSDIAVTKSADNTTPAPGATVTYTITASDSGVDATGVVVQDILPTGLTFVSTSSADTIGNYASTTGNWTIGKLSSTTTATLHIVTTVGSSLANGTVISNMATVTAGETSTDTGNNSSTAPVTVTVPTSGGGGGSSGGGGGSSGGGGGGNGPIVGSFGGGGGGGNGPIVPEGQVLGASTSTCDQYLTAFIKSGQQNDPTQVMRLQTVLKDYEGANVQINGTYDAATLAATEAFQAKYASDVLAPWGITSPTGYVYLTTRREINDIYCHFTQNFALTANQQAIINAARIAATEAGPVITSGTGHSTSMTNAMKQAAAAAAAQADMMGNASSSTTGSSSPVTKNPFSGIGSFFKKLFGR